MGGTPGGVLEYDLPICGGRLAARQFQRLIAMGLMRETDRVVSVRRFHSIILTLGLMCVFLAGCAKDLSNDPRFRPLVGRTVHVLRPTCAVPPPGEKDLSKACYGLRDASQPLTRTYEINMFGGRKEIPPGPAIYLPQG